MTTCAFLACMIQVYVIWSSHSPPPFDSPCPTPLFAFRFARERKKETRAMCASFLPLSVAPQGRDNWQQSDQKQVCDRGHHVGLLCAFHRTLPFHAPAGGCLDFSGRKAPGKAGRN